MRYDFSSTVSREGSNALKYTLREKLFGSEDILPLWVADMDINTPHFVLDALQERLKHPLFGYEEIPKEAFEAQQAWMKKVHGVFYDIENFFYSHSVVASIRVAIEAFTEKGEGVVVQTPIYPPFIESVKRLDRKVVKNPLKQKSDGTYCFDIEDLKSKIDRDTKLLLLCSPHNPVGRVWREDELREILSLCREHNIVVFSDEIHCDLIYDGYRHIPFSSLGEEAKEISLSAIGTAKTFNMAGFAISSVVISAPELKKRFKEVYDRVHFAEGSILSHIAYKAAYQSGYEWLEALKKHLYSNYRMLESLALKYTPYIKVTPIEASYLAWIDCRGMGVSDKEIRRFFTQEAKLGLASGVSFGREGRGFMRLNFAVSSDTMQEIVKRLESALQRRQFGSN